MAKTLGIGLTVLFLILTVLVGATNVLSPPEVRVELFEPFQKGKGEKSSTPSFRFTPGAFGLSAPVAAPKRKPGKPVDGMKLNGVVVSSNSKESVAFVNLPNSSTSKRVKIGDKLNAYRCTGIDDNSVTLTYQNKSIKLKLFDRPALPIVSDASLGANLKADDDKASKIKVVEKESLRKIPKEEVREYRKSLKRLSSSEKKDLVKKKKEDPSWAKALKKSKD
jgi:hypothetical protein